MNFDAGLGNLRRRVLCKASVGFDWFDITMSFECIPQVHSALPARRRHPMHLTRMRYLSFVHP